MVVKERGKYNSVMVNKNGNNNSSSSSSMTTKRTISLNRYLFFIVYFFVLLWLFTMWNMLYHLDYVVQNRNQKTHFMEHRSSINNQQEKVRPLFKVVKHPQHPQQQQQQQQLQQQQLHEHKKRQKDRPRFKVIEKSQQQQKPQQPQQPHEHKKEQKDRSFFKVTKITQQQQKLQQPQRKHEHKKKQKDPSLFKVIEKPQQLHGHQTKQRREEQQRKQPQQLEQQFRVRKNVNQNRKKSIDPQKFQEEIKISDVEVHYPHQKNVNQTRPQPPQNRKKSINLQEIQEEIQVSDVQVHYPHQLERIPPPPWEANGMDLIQKGEKKFIIFQPIKYGQGAGNNMAGLLAVHLLAIEFDRIVCVSPEFDMFHLVFEPIHPMVLRFCPEFLKNERKNSTLTVENSFELLTYKSAPNECDLKKMLQSDVRTWFITANTYPRWPKVPDNFFFTYYRAKPALLNFLPYNQHIPPEIVVHLRSADGTLDRRRGLDNATLQGLGRMLPQNSSTFLVSNNVVWFDEMEEQFGWAHPDWSLVRHCSLGIEWGTRNNTIINNEKQPQTTLQHEKQQRKQGDLPPDGRELQRLQLFSDWYTLLTAKQVYHTHSDFSISAVHWMNIDSKVINGYSSSKNTVMLEEEYFRKPKGESPRLVDRTDLELERCSIPWKKH